MPKRLSRDTWEHITYTRLQITIPSDLIPTLDYLAKANHTNRSDLIARLILDAYNDENHKHQRIYI